MYKVSIHKAVKFRVKIPNGCRENSENFRGLLFAAPCISQHHI